MKREVFAGWWQVAACMLLQAVGTATISGAFGVVAVPIGEAFETSRMLLMLPMTVNALAVGLLSPGLGTAMDRHSLRNLMLLGAAALVGGFAALSLVTSMAQVLLIYGLLLAPANVLLGPLATSALLSRWFFRKRGAALGIAAAGISLGGLIFPPLIQLLIDTFEWREAFRILSGIILCLTTPAILLVVVNHPGERGLHPDGESAAAQVAAEKAQGDRYASTGAVLRDPSFWLISLVMAALLCGNKGVLTNIVPLAIDLGTRADLAALLISMFSAGSLAGKILFAGLADRFDPRTVMAAGITGFGLGMSCLWRAELGYFMMATGGLCLGFATGGMLPLKGLLLARAFGPQNVGRVMGMMSMTIMPLNLVSPPLFGWIHDRTGSYDLAMLLFVCLAALALVTLPRIRTRPRTAPQAAGAAAL